VLEAEPQHSVEDFAFPVIALEPRQSRCSYPKKISAIR